MNKPCASCNKTVYPMEKLNCLDKIWHKGCFKCTSCGMTLNMKNYKGYNKDPYCSAHYPTTKFTAIADTPENRRIAANTKVQSNIQYHAEFEQAKGKYTSVSDDPESLRLKKSTEIASQIAYKNIRGTREDMEAHRPVMQEFDDGQKEQAHGARNSSSGGGGGAPPRPTPGKIADYDPASNNTDYNSPYDQRKQMTTIYDTEQGGKDRASYGGHRQMGFSYGGGGGGGPVEQQAPRQIGKIEDYDPVRARGDKPPPQQQYHPQAPPQQPPPAQANKGMVCRALYDYTAADTDEISFLEGDLLIHCDPIDDGWMEGRVERTGQVGMLPSNYVEKV